MGSPRPSPPLGTIEKTVIRSFMKRIKGISDVSKSFELLDKIRKIKNGSIKLTTNQIEYDIDLESIDKEICFTINHHALILNSDNWEFRDALITHGDLKINIPLLWINEQKLGQIKGVIPSFHFEDFNVEEQKFQRLALPISKKPNFVFSVENIVIEYQNKLKIDSREATEIKVDGISFRLYVVMDNITKLSKRDYLVLESKTKMSHTQFSEYCFSILICFGYVSGDFVNDNGYFFQYSSDLMVDVIGLSYSKMRGSIKCKYVPIYSNPYGYIHDPQKSEGYKEKIRNLTINEFSKLCQYCHSNDEIKSVILLLIEVQDQSLVSGPGTLSIALEAITNEICNKNKSSITPIKSKEVSTSLRKELLEVLKKYDDKIDKEGLKIISSKIQQINQSTNRDKLLIPFKVLNIPIYSTDIEAIDQRNAFLHGRSPMLKNNEPESIDEEDKTRFYLFLKLYVLVSAIVMKYIGFDNLIVNYPKIFEKETGIILDEEYYRQI